MIYIDFLYDHNCHLRKLWTVVAYFIDINLDQFVIIH